MPKQAVGLSKCSVGGCEKPNDAPKGLCKEHYRRLRNYGTFEKLRRPKGKAICSADGCENPDNGGMGMCRRHYSRHRHHGHTGLVNTGKKRSHPMYPLWYDRKAEGCLAPEWLAFERFVADISPKPDDDVFLVRIDAAQPYGPGNFKWQSHLKRRPGEPLKEWWARKWSARHAANPGMQRSREMRRRYGLTVEQYDALKDAQGGKCAICRNPESAVDPKVGTVRRLAVDHCHATGKIRGLLCFRCNSTIGRLEDDPALASAILLYLTETQI